MGDAAVMLCPRCGYDLRATAGGRCSECGLEVDREALQESGFPWAHRRKIGRIRAYARTVWWVIINSRRLATESARPQEACDGRAFRRVTAEVLAVVLLVGWALLVAENKGLAFLAYRPAPIGAPPSAAGTRWLADLAVPWSAGATLRWVLPLCLVLLAVYLTGVQQAVFRVQGQEHQLRAGVIAHYAAAPLVLLAPALLCWTLSAMADQARSMATLTDILRIAAVLLIAAALGGTLVRVGQWVSRVRYGAPAAGALAAAELLGLWLLGIALMIGLLPWSIGFVWIVIDSFR